MAKRYKKTDVCKECGYQCDDRLRCEPARGDLRSYSGIRPTSDGFDCALPITIDSHSICSYACLYCFSDNLIAHREGRSRPIGQTSLRAVEALFAGEPGKQRAIWQKALRFDKRNENGYPCPVQLGAINDPCDHIERQQGWLLDFIKLAIKYNQPVRMSTKGTVFQLPEYLDAIGKAPYLFWVAFSIITPDDELLEKIDRRAPNATARLGAMRALSDIGVKTSLRFRPILPRVSDSTPNYPEAWRVLIEKAAAAGAQAISYEVGFVPGAMTQDTRWRWEQLSDLVNVPFRELYRKFGPTIACMRPSPMWTENIMHAIHDKAHELSMTVGVSDPVWKQLSDVGCCCGIKPDDPVFGNWERENATNALVNARDNGQLIVIDDVIPPWARVELAGTMVNPGAGPKVAWMRRHEMWADKVRSVWNDLASQRGPLNYFQGALMPAHRDENGDMVYVYKGLERVYPTAAQTPYLSVEPYHE